MSVIGGQNIPLTDGLVYALDFKNGKCFTTGSFIVNSLIYNLPTAVITGSFLFDTTNLTLNVSQALNPSSTAYGSNDFNIRRNSTFEFHETSSFTIASNLNVQTPGIFIFQNTDTAKFAAQISTSSLEIGFYNPATEYYYTRLYSVNFQTGSVNLIYRYNNGTADLFINGMPVTSSRTNVVPRAIQSTYYSSKVLSQPVSSSFNLGNQGRVYSTYRPEFMLTPFGGSITNLYIYNKVLSSSDVYALYAALQPTVFKSGPAAKPYSLDENTLMYVSASRITSSSTITAVDNFVMNLKSAGIWNKLGAVYPFIGITTSSHAINLKEPGVNSLVYTGSWSASMSGSYAGANTSYVQLPTFEYPALTVTSSHVTYLTYDALIASGSLVGISNTLSATGGEMFYSGSRVYHVFRPTGTSSFTVFNPGLTSVEVLVIGGGGSGASAGYNAGGGGAGGLVYSSSVSVSTGTYNVIVGEGGQDTNGHNSSFSTVTAYGGGRGNSGNGASGGGAGSTFNTTGSGGTASYGDQGNNGGDSREIYNWGAGGGGGHGSPGETAGTTTLRSAAGGSGSYFARYAGIGLGTPAGWFAGGGGSGGGLVFNTNAQRGPGGIGGGGAGSIENNYGLYNSPPFSGPGIPTASKNTGGGGGGAWYNNGFGGFGAGGSGIVIISYSASLASFTSSFGLNVSGSKIIGNLHSTNTSGIPLEYSIGLVSVNRTGSNAITIHKDVTSSVYTAPVTASRLGTVFANAVNFTGSVSNFALVTMSYMSYGAGLTPSEMTSYHGLVSKLQYDLGRANLIEGYPAAAAYSVRQLSRTAQYSMNVRRGDDLQQDIGFVSGDLNTGSLLTFLTASISTPLPGDTATPAVAYSVRKVRTAYTGSAMTVRRDFDDLTFDVGFDVSGNLDTGSLLRNMTASLNTPALPGDYSGLAAAYSLRKVSSSYLGNAVEVRRASDNYSASIGFDSLGNLNTASLASLIRTGSETPISAYSGLSVAYSLRKVVPGYAGFVIQIQSASATQDIGFNSFGDLDVAAIRAFAGSGDAFVRTWYDQSGNGYNATQTTLVSQPKIYSGSLGTVVTQGGKPAISFVNNTMNISGIPSSSNYNDFWVMQPTDDTFIPLIANSGNRFSWVAQQDSTSTSLYEQFGTPALYKNSTLSTPTTRGSIYTAFNGYNLIHTAGANTTTWTSGWQIAGYSSPYNFAGNLQEILIYTASVSTNRTYIENNINSYYGIYTPSSVSTENAFVKTWYDQSGNNRHATQSVDANQPQIVSNGVITVDGNRPAIRFDGTDDYFTFNNINTDVDYIGFQVVKKDTTNTIGIPVAGTTISDSYLAWNYNDNSLSMRSARGQLVGATLSTTAKQLFTSLNIQTGNNTIWANGSLVITGAPSTQGGTGVMNAIGRRTAGEYGLGTTQEIIIYQSNITSSKSLIEDNINGYYNIFTQSLTSGSGYVTRWYDQSGNNSHATQSVANFQPLILSSGSIVTQSGKPALRLDGVNDYLYSDFATISQPNSYFITTTQPADSFGFIFDANTPNRQALLQSNPVGGLEFFAGGGFAAANGTTVGNTRYLYSATANGANSYVYLNSNLIASGNVGSSGISDLFIGTRYSLQNYGNLNIQEFILYPSDQSANKPSINNNINNYFNIYNLNSSTSSLFVTKWYDQSGNSKHATQSVALNQPLILSSGSIVTLYGNPSLQFTGTSRFDLISSPLSFSNNSTHYFVHTNTGGGTIFGTIGYRYGVFDTATSVTFGTGTGKTVNTSQNVREGLITFTQTSVTNGVRIHKNSVDVTTTAASTSGGDMNKIGYTGIGPQIYLGKISEIISIARYVDPENRQPIESNINSYYRIY